MEILLFYLKPISRRKCVVPKMAPFNVAICQLGPESGSRSEEEDISVFGAVPNEGGYSCPERGTAPSCIFHLFELNDQSQS